MHSHVNGLRKGLILLTPTTAESSPVYRTVTGSFYLNSCNTVTTLRVSDAEKADGNDTYNAV